jgi:hypothetical protein
MTTSYLFPVSSQEASVLGGCRQAGTGRQSSFRPITFRPYPIGSVALGLQANVQPSWTPGMGLPLGDPSTELGLARYKHYDAAGLVWVLRVLAFEAGMR